MSIDFQTAESTLMQHFTSVMTTWDAALAARTLRRNEHLSGSRELSDPWMRWDIVEALGETPEIGGPISQVEMEMKVDIFLPLGTGTQLGEQISDKVALEFQGQKIGDVICKESRWTSFGADNEGGANFWHEEVRVAFLFENN